jgi:hypothetical protein
LKPHQLNVPADKFKGQFGLEWQAALDSGKVMNALDACAALGISADDMDAQWGICKKAKKLIKFGGGFYCGLIEIEGKDSLYVFNGFFMSMRSKFTAPGTSIYYYVVAWDSAKTSWADFRGAVLGPTDPVEAPADSLRGQIYAKWEALGLSAVPDVGDNGVHASASPFEALAERANWLSADIATDSFGAQLIAAGVSLDTIKDWSVDPQVSIGGKKGSLFDSVEDINTADCVAQLVATNAENAPAPVAAAAEAAVVVMDDAAAAARAAALAATAKANARVKKPRAEVIAPPAKGVPTPPEKYLIYDDDTSIGKKAPTLGTLEVLTGEPVMFSKEKGTVIVFWSKAFKGDYPILCQMADIANDFEDDLQFVGISIDGKKSDAEGFCKKLGTAMPELNVKKLAGPDSLAWDNGNEIKDAYQKTGKLLSLMPSSCYIVDKDRNIVWREEFNQGHHLTKGQFREQVRRFVLGEALVSNGNRPVEEEEMEMGDDYDSDLGF